MTDDAYRIDPRRLQVPESGIYVRAQLGLEWKSADIASLGVRSLKLWLRSRGGDNPWAERTVALLLGHHPNDINEEWEL